MQYSPTYRKGKDSYEPISDADACKLSVVNEYSEWLVNEQWKKVKRRIIIDRLLKLTKTFTQILFPVRYRTVGSVCYQLL